jgi:hypothetical protein
MTRTLHDLSYSEGNIASGRCTGCGQVFATSLLALAASENTEVALVGAFGGHECTACIPAPSKPIA